MNLKSVFMECFVESLTQKADKTAHAHAAGLTHDSKAWPWKHSGLLFSQNDHKLTQKGVRSVQMRNIKLNMQT